MELVKEIYDYLEDKNLEWPQHALCAMRDGNGDIKFSSNTKSYVSFDEKAGMYSRGVDCFINSQIEDAPEWVGTKNSPEIISRAAYENFYYATK